jgi:hypothetical protein
VDFGLEHPYVVDPVLFTRLSGLEVHPQILKLRPVGHRLIVMMNPPVTEWKGLVVPQANLEFQAGGSGWVVACGPMVGAQGIPHPGGPVCHPEDLLYMQVLFSAAVGSGIRVEFLETRTMCKCYTLTDRDVWHVDWNPSEYLPASVDPDEDAEGEK